MIARRHYLALMVTAALVAFSASSEAEQHFTLQSLRGAWGFSASGTLGPGIVGPAAVPAAAVGLIDFDGVGGCTETAKLNAGAVIPLISTACSYTVTSDGFGSLTVTFGPLTFTADFVIVDVAKEFHFIVSDAVGTVANGVAKRQVR